MPTTTNDLRDLHDLHRRARALRDRLESAPKTLASRQKALELRQKNLEEARNALKAARAGIHKKETTVAGLHGKIDDLRIKLNAVKKNEEYKALLNQIAHDEAAIRKFEDETLDLMGAVETQAADLIILEAEFKKAADEVAAFEAEINARADNQRTQLKELELAMKDGESIIPADVREAFRRVIKQRGDDAFAAVHPDVHACSGCYLSVTLQGVNDLINAQELCFCKSCGRILYLTES